MPEDLHEAVFRMMPEFTWTPPTAYPPKADAPFCPNADYMSATQDACDKGAFILANPNSTNWYLRNLYDGGIDCNEFAAAVIAKQHEGIPAEHDANRTALYDAAHRMIHSHDGMEKPATHMKDIQIENSASPLAQWHAYAQASVRSGDLVSFRSKEDDVEHEMIAVRLADNSIHFLSKLGMGPVIVTTMEQMMDIYDVGKIVSDDVPCWIRHVPREQLYFYEKDPATQQIKAIPYEEYVKDSAGG